MGKTAVEREAGLESYFRDVARQPMMSAEEEAKVARKWRSTRRQKLADRLVSANLRFVIKIALEYRNYGFPLVDLVQEGNLGLVRSVQTFDPDRGYRLISYAVWWIRAFIQEYILRNWSLVKIGTTQLQRRLFNRLQSSQKRMERLVADSGPSAEGARRQALARVVGGTVRDVEEMERRLQQRDGSLDAGSDRDGYSLHERLPHPEGDCEQLLATEESKAVMNRELAGVMEQLGHRERTIVECRHLAEKNWTLRELGDHLGISKERVRQLEVRALERLKAGLCARSAPAELLAA
jgi:RNA polymerase sigma-32 factor